MKKQCTDAYYSRSSAGAPLRWTLDAPAASRSSSPTREPTATISRQRLGGVYVPPYMAYDAPYEQRARGAVLVASKPQVLLERWAILSLINHYHLYTWPNHLKLATLGELFATKIVPAHARWLTRRAFRMRVALYASTFHVLHMIRWDVIIIWKCLHLLVCSIPENMFRTNSNFHQKLTPSANRYRPKNPAQQTRRCTHSTNDTTANPSCTYSNQIHIPTRANAKDT